MIRHQRVMLNDQLWQIGRHHSFAGETHVAISHILVCPACTRVWALLQFLDEPFAWPRAAFCGCVHHADEWHPVPGSLLCEEGYGTIDDSLLSALPDSLIQREFQLHLKAYS